MFGGGVVSSKELLAARGREPFAPSPRKSTPKFLRGSLARPRARVSELPEVAAQGPGEVSVSQPWARPGCARQAGHCPGGAQQLVWKTGQPSPEPRICGVGRAALPGRPARPRPQQPRPQSPSPSRAPPIGAREGGVAFKSSPVFWGPRAGRADLVRMSRAVTPAPGSMCEAEGRIIWPAARAGGAAERAPRARAAPQAQRARAAGAPGSGPARCPRARSARSRVSSQQTWPGGAGARESGSTVEYGELRCGSLRSRRGKVPRRPRTWVWGPGSREVAEPPRCLLSFSGWVSVPAGAAGAQHVGEWRGERVHARVGGPGPAVALNPAAAVVAAAAAAEEDPVSE